MLEPYEAQVSSTVLRGRGGSNTSLLPGCETQVRAPLKPKGGARRVFFNTRKPTCPICGSCKSRGNARLGGTGGSLTVRSAARFTPDGSNSTRFRPSGRQKSAKQSPIEISHKALSLKELTSD